jgi:hypothetical protein
MATSSATILRISPKKILILSFLYLFLFGFLDKAPAQNNEKNYSENILSKSSITISSSLTVEERIKKLEQRVQSLEKKPKDFWDKLSAISALISGLTIALIGYWATNTYKRREIAISQVQIVRDLMPQLRSSERRDVQVALGLIGCSGSPDIVAVLASVYQNEVEAIAALSTLVSSTQDPTVKKKSQRSLDTLLKSSKLLNFEQRFHDLASEYEQSRGFPAGNERTQKMKAIFTAMKGLAPIGQPLLPTLISSNSLGDWLSAIAILQEKPSPDYLEWLAGKIAEDPGAFHGYQAAVALRKAIGMIGEEKVKPAIEKLRDLMLAKADGQNLLKQDAFKVLRPPEPLVLQWAKQNRAKNPYDMGPKNYEKCSYDLGYPGWNYPLIRDEDGTLRYQ